MDTQAAVSHPQEYVPVPPEDHQNPVVTSCGGNIHSGALDADASLSATQGDASYEISGSPPCEDVEEQREDVSWGHRDIQGNALQNWQTHVRQRRQQQDQLSNLLHRPVKMLLMNQDGHFRETQGQKEILNQVLPLIHSGYGHRVGSEFWTLPQRFGDDLSGITATLTQTEQGRRRPVTHTGQPSTILQELGISCTENQRPASRTWEQSAYLQHQCQELGELLQDLRKPDISGLAVTGRGKPCGTVCHSPSLEREVEDEEEHMEEKRPEPQSDEAPSDVLLGPALRFCGQLATWTGHSAANQGEVGISATIMFEAPTGERVSSPLEMHNEGTTAIFYSWQQLPRQNSFPNLRTQSKSQNFYFNSSSGVILPGDTQHIELIFKSERPGIDKEVWQLNTHPVLLQGAAIQVTLRGVAHYQDTTADQRHFMETNLENTVVEKMCRSIVDNMLQKVKTQQRPSSPAELYITEEERFLSKNPKLQYHHQLVEGLQTLWEEVNPGLSWDGSVDTLRQAVLAVPAQESAWDTRERVLAQLNSLLLQHSEPAGPKPPPSSATGAPCRQQLWRRVLDGLAEEAIRLRGQLGLPETLIWADKDDELATDADADDDGKDAKSEKKTESTGKEKRESRSRLSETDKEESKKKGKRRDEAGKRSKEKQEREAVSLTEPTPESSAQQLPVVVDPKMMEIYQRFLHQKVHSLMEDMMNTMCDLMDEDEDAQEL